MTTKVKTQTVHIGLLLDESGSMQGNERAVVEGVNEFIGNLAGDTKDKDVRASLAMFDLTGGDEVVRVKYSNTPLDKTRELSLSDYSPRGSTPLNDAVVKTIKRMEGEVGKKDKAMLVIFTDGYENSSETKTEEVRKAIERKEEDGWAFIYLGANQDAWAEGTSRGVQRSSSFTFQSTPQGTGSTMSTSSNAAKLYTNTDKATYDSAMANMNTATGGQLDEDTVLDPEDFVDKEADTKRSEAITEATDQARKALEEE